MNKHSFTVDEIVPPNGSKHPLRKEKFRMELRNPSGPKHSFCCGLKPGLGEGQKNNVSYKICCPFMSCPKISADLVVEALLTKVFGWATNFVVPQGL